MKITPIRGFLFAGALCALVVSARAQYVTLRATINQAQENPPTGSAATGSAIMHFYPASNTFDLMVSVTGWSGTATASHIHEAAVGTNGPVMSPNFGGDAAYAKVGNTLTGTFLNQRYTGSAAELLKGNSYYNLHSTAFPGGEIRGQLVAQPLRLVAKMDVAQEAAAMPTQNFAGLNDFGGAVMWYNPATNQISLRSSVFNFNNTMNNSHFHEGVPGVSGGVVQNLGPNPNGAAGSAANQLATYSNLSGSIQGSYDGVYGGDVAKLLSGGAYLNYHSTTFAGGELRGQVTMATETPSTRMANLSVRGFVGTGEQVLITGIAITGDEPVRVLVTAKGPSLTALGVTGALANPVLRLFDSANRLIATNDDIGAIAAGSELASIPWAPRTAAESALVVVLPPGNYTASVSAATGTGVALLEVYDLRSINPAVVTN
jgi:hypothetical protein